MKWLKDDDDMFYPESKVESLTFDDTRGVWKAYLNLGEEKYHEVQVVEVLDSLSAVLQQHPLAMEVR